MVHRRSGKVPDHALPQHTDNTLERLRSRLAPAGLDLVVPFSLEWCTGNEQGSSLAASLTGLQDDALGVLIGNSRKLWQPFLAEYKCSEELQASDHPLDTYIENQLLTVMSTDLRGLRWRVCWANGHQATSGQDSPMAMQRLAHLIGFAYYNSTSHLCLHQKFGPWFSMRAVIIFEGLSYGGPCPQQLKCPLSAQNLAYVKMAVRSARTSMDADESRARRPEDASAPPPPQHWQKWAAVREATCPGNPWKFDKRQLEYHYTQSASVLRRAISISRRSLDGHYNTN
ncbi:hypothetical protein WJX74_005136 [Apatococcus lobatus]|uniref:Cyanocobalamin reductase (cyanide-eliminating) n=1 Tax=Apatococcus lobatus TaxID=904363 RepID=A0AAW1S3E0_9CHLO